MRSLKLLKRLRKASKMFKEFVILHKPSGQLMVGKVFGINQVRNGTGGLKWTYIYEIDDGKKLRTVFVTEDGEKNFQLLGDL